MNIEELKLVLDTIREVASTAGYVGIAWVLLHYLVMAISALAMPVAWAVIAVKVAQYAASVWTAPKVVERKVRVGDLVLTEDAWERFEKVIRTKVADNKHGYVYSTDVMKLEKALDAYRESQGAGK